MATKKQKQELLKDAANSSAWKEAIRPELEERLDMLKNILITLSIEESKNYTAGEIMIGRRLASAHLQDVINMIDGAGLLQEADAEAKKKDSFE